MLARIGILCCLCFAFVCSATGLRAQSFPFFRSTVAGTQSTSPTSLQWGPDERLYVAQVDGEIDIYTVQRNGVSDYVVTATETLTSVRDLPNHNDDGTPAPSVTGRVCTGLLVVGTAQAPVIYVTSSDPRIAIAVDSGLDTNSGVLTRLTWDPMTQTWEHLDLVRGLPRNEENHASNGMVLDEATNTLYLAQGGHTNMGAPSINFAFQPEYALSSAILTIDLDAIGDTTFDLPTLDDPRADETRLFNGVVQTVDVADPFGGNNGENQALLEASSPVQIYAPGLRNAYDLLLLPDGKLYTIDNGPNGGWGGPPLGCVSASNETDSRTYGDALHYVGNINVNAPGSYYGGHPNLTRGNRANTFNGVSPIHAAAQDPRECIYERPFGTGNPPPAPHDQLDPSLITWDSSTNGFDVFTGSNFGGNLAGQLIVTQWNGDLVRAQLDATGTSVVDSATLSQGSDRLLDADTLDDQAMFPGTIWLAVYSADRIDVLEPDDFGAINCVGSDDPALDEDGDGYTNADEIDNGTNPCSQASKPADQDGDGVSDLNDPDDDNDGIPDVTDRFALDLANGELTAPRIDFGWALGNPGYGILGLGFTGLMSDGVRPWDQLFDPAQMAAGGAAGLVTIENVSDGFALFDDSDADFHLGVDIDSSTPLTRVRSTIRAPYFSARPALGLEMLGIQIGTGTQDDYVAVVLSGLLGVDSAALMVLEEQGGVLTRADIIPSSWLGGVLLASEEIELGFDVDPAAGTFTPVVRIDPYGEFPLDVPQTPGPALLSAMQGPDAVAVGLFSSSVFGQPFNAIWDDITIGPDEPSSSIAIDPPGVGFDASTFGSGSFAITNTSQDAIEITAVEFDLTTALLPDIVFDPSGTAGDIVAKPFQVDQEGGTGFVGHDFVASYHNGTDPDDGFDRLRLTFADFDPGETMTFSIDNDPSSIKGTTAPGPNECGSISGLEMIGTTVTVEYDDGTVQTQRTSRLGTTLDASVAGVVGGLQPATLQFVPAPAGTEVTNPNQVVRVTARPYTTVRLTRCEGCLFINGTQFPMNGPFPSGYDLQPDEVNSIVSVDSTTVFTGPTGIVDIPVVLTRFQGDGSYGLGSLDETGLNIITAEIVEDTATTLRGPIADPLRLRLVPPPVSGVVYRVNAGGSQTAASDGNGAWQQDTGGTPSSLSNFAQTGNATYSVGSAITLDPSVPSGTPTSLFQTERFSQTAANQVWTFSVPVGETVDVKLYFAEIFFQNPGQRTFDVVVEGTVIESGLDLVQRFGPNVGGEISTQVVSDGAITVELVRGLDNPKISAIEIFVQ